MPSNDERQAAEVLAAGGQPVVQPAHGATRAPSDPSLTCVGNYSASLWFRVRPKTAVSVTVDTAGSDYNTVAAVFTEPGGGALEEVTCNNNAAPGTETSLVTWEAGAGRTYWVVIASSANRGAGALRIQAN